jgi:hypothetical protein
MGNAPVYYLGAAPSEIDMRVPETVRKSVLFIGIRDLDGSITYGGTAFIVTVPGTRGNFGYVVTAKHGTSAILEVTANHWSVHEDATVDAAVAPIILNEKLDLDFRGIPVSNFLNAEIIAETSDRSGRRSIYHGSFHSHCWRVSEYANRQNGYGCTDAARKDSARWKPH